MKFNDNFPIYIQIMDLIKRQIIVGKLGEGEKLESVRELSTELKVNPNTIQRSYQELEREGLVFTKRGMGTFVTENVNIINELKDNMAFNMINEFLNNMKSLGFNENQILNLINENIRGERNE